MHYLLALHMHIVKRVLIQCFLLDKITIVCYKITLNSNIWQPVVLKLFSSLELLIIIRKKLQVQFMMCIV